jgi:Leucine-rich repeat (LRR) protein
VPEEVLELANLRTLEIMYNHLQTLPPELGNKLGRLKNLDVSHNKLTKLPPSIAKYAPVCVSCVCVVRVSCVRALNLQNRVCGTRRLVELRQLDLSCNKLPHIPEEVLRLPHLKFLSFGYNKLTNDEKKTLKKRFKD